MKAAPALRGGGRLSWVEQVRGGPVSRVLSWAAIYLGRSSPTASSAQPERSAGHTMALLFAFAPDGACQAVALPRRWWSLTPPFQLFPLRGPRAGQLESSFLRRFPSGYPARPLAGILPCGARTFLMTLARPAVAWPTSRQGFYHETIRCHPAAVGLQYNLRIAHIAAPDGMQQERLRTWVCSTS